MIENTIGNIIALADRMLDDMDYESVMEFARRDIIEELEDDETYFQESWSLHMEDHPDA